MVQGTEKEVKIQERAFRPAKLRFPPNPLLLHLKVGALQGHQIKALKLMYRNPRTPEELLARKLVSWIASLVALLFFAAVIFHVASRPPKPEAFGRTDKAQPRELPDLELQAFRDRIARIRLSAWPLETRKKEALKLLSTAPTPELRKEAEKLLTALKREESYKRALVLQAFRRKLLNLAANNKFKEAEELLSDFGKKNPSSAEELNQLRRELSRYKRRAFFRLSELAENAILAGDVKKASELMQRAFILAPPEYQEQVKKWPERAKEKAEALALLTKEREAVKGEGIDISKKTQKTSSSLSTKEVSESESPPSEEITKKPFAGFLSCVSGRKIKTAQGEELYLHAENAEVYQDERLPEEALGNEVDRGTGLWIFGRPVVRRGVLRPFGRTLARTLEDASLAILNGSFIPSERESTAGSRSGSRNRWLFGKVEIAFPVLRLTLEGGETFLVKKSDFPIIKRTKLLVLPELKPNQVLYVEGIQSGQELWADRVIVLESSLSKSDIYRSICR